MLAKKLLPLAALAAFLVAGAFFLVAGCDKDQGVHATNPATYAKSETPVTDAKPTVQPADVQTTGAPSTVSLNLPPPSPGAPLYTPSPDDGKVTGTATFKGERPKRSKVDLSKDEKCVAANSKPMLSEDEIVNKDTFAIKNVFVYVTKGYEKFQYKPKTTPSIDQNCCRYEPHVFGMMPGQKIAIKNSDDTTHNIHGLPRKSKEFNFTQNKQGATDQAVLDNAEEAIKIKCDIHPWMGAWVFVLPHNLFATTDENGKFAITEMPEGEFEVTAWHEVYGASKPQTAKVAKGAEVKIDFTFEKK